MCHTNFKGRALDFIDLHLHIKPRRFGSGFYFLLKAKSIRRISTYTLPQAELISLIRKEVGKCKS